MSGRWDPPDGRRGGESLEFTYVGHAIACHTGRLSRSCTEGGNDLRLLRGALTAAMIWMSGVSAADTAVAGTYLVHQCARGQSEPGSWSLAPESWPEDG